MRAHPSFLILLSGLMIVSCARHELPPVKDAEALRKDCAILYEQFPVSELSTNAPDYQYQHGLGIRKISNDKWPPSILALHPYMVCNDQGGIALWIVPSKNADQGKWWNGYYVVVNPKQPTPQAATHHMVFSPTKQNGILLMKQEKF